MTSEPSEPAVERRVAVGPVVAAVVALVVFAIIATVVITLAAASSSPSPVSSSSAPHSSAPEPKESEAPAVESSVVPPRAESTGAQCIDYTAEVDSLDIESVNIAQSDRDAITIEILLAAPVAEQSARLGVVATDGDGDRAYEFSIELDEGEVDEVSAYDFTRDDRDELDSDDAAVTGSTVRFEVPRSLGKKLDDQWTWHAFSGTLTTVIDVCPGTPDAPEFLRFER